MASIPERSGVDPINIDCAAAVSTQTTVTIKCLPPCMAHEAVSSLGCLDCVKSVAYGDGEGLIKVTVNGKWQYGYNLNFLNGKNWIAVMIDPDDSTTEQIESA